MNSFRILDRRWVSVAAVFALLIASIVPALAFAAQVTERSIEVSNSSADMSGVTYRVNFKSVQAAGVTVIEFCDNSPLIGSQCDAPVGFTAGSATTPTSGFTLSNTANKVVATGTVAADTAISFELANIHNPTAAGPLYARIVTYADGTAAAAYPNVSSAKDQGGVALSITPTVGVSGAVQESLSFCIAKNAIAKNCVLDTNDDGTDDNPAPTLALGEDVGGTVALVPGTVSTGSIYTQISTNAVGGAVISLKSNNTCGGLKRFGLTTCDIAPAGITAGVVNTSALFGLRTAAAASDPSDVVAGESNGTLQAAGSYNDAQYRLNFAQDALSGVTSTYGDPLLDTDNAPVNNKNMQLTFAATVTNQTPAGLYSTDLSMIATGKF